MSAVEIIQTQIQTCRAEQAVSCPPEAAREFALAITHLEDAAMRLHRGLMMKGGVIPSTLLGDLMPLATEAFSGVRAEPTGEADEQIPGQLSLDELT